MIGASYGDALGFIGMVLFATSAAEVEDRVSLSFDVNSATHEDVERAKAILS